MKNLTKKEIKNIAQKNGMIFQEFGEFLEITNPEKHEGFQNSFYDEKKMTFSDWSFFGDIENQGEYLKLWDDLTGSDEFVGKIAFTPEIAKKYINKEIDIFYFKGGFKNEFIIKPVNLFKIKSSLIGQKSHYKLSCILIKDLRKDITWKNKEGILIDWFYEWRRKFRVTSSADVVYCKICKDTC